MKHTIYYVLGLALLFGATGCSRQESNLFDQSAAERLQALEQEVRTNLTGASNGWEMRYFPEPDAAGYALLVRFQQDGTVTFGAKNPVSSFSMYQEETSLWDMDGTQGCVLTFNSYNDLFSIFADPGSDGIGEGGDYEFVVLKNEANTIQLKGKKHGAYVTMNRLSDGQDWQEYFKAIDRLYNETFAGNDGITFNYWNGEKAITVRYESGTINYTLSDELEIYCGFLLTPSGVHFYSGMPVAGTQENAKDFVLSEDKKVLQSPDGKVFFSSQYSAADFFVYRFGNYSRWIYEKEGTDSGIQASIDSICAAARVNGAEINTIGYERTTSTNAMGGRTYTYGLRISYVAGGKLFSGNIVLNSTVKDNTITFSYKSHDEALEPLFARFAEGSNAYELFCKIFCGTFAAESYTGSELNMTQLKLTNQSTGAAIHLQAEKIIM